MKSKHLLSLLFAAAGFIESSAQPVVPVSSFGNGGVFKETVNAEIVDESNPIVQPDGKLLFAVGGDDETGYLTQRFIYRITATGDPDASFANNGILQVGLLNQESGYSISRGGDFDLQADGKIVAVTIRLDRDGELPGKIVIERYLSDGSPDSSFGTNGFTEVLQNYRTVYSLRDVKVKPDGKIVVAGNIINTETGTYNSAIVQITADGRLDQSFGNGGKLLAIVPYEQNINQLLVLPNNHFITASTYAGDNYNINLCEVDHNPDGSLDKKVGTSGVITNGLSPSFAGIALQGGKLLVYASFVNNDSLMAVLLRYNANGTPDVSFGSNGKAIVASYSSKYLSFQHTVKVQDNGKIIVTDASIHELRRFTADGEPDSSFGNNGSLIDPLPTDSYLDFALNHHLLYELGIIDETNNALPQLVINAYRFCYSCAVPGNNENMITEEKIPGALSGTAAVSVFPNPAQSKIVVTGLPAGSVTHLQLTDANGRVVQKAITQNTSFTWNVASLTRGVYYVGIVTDNRKRVTFKVVKE